MYCAFLVCYCIFSVAFGLVLLIVIMVDCGITGLWLLICCGFTLWLLCCDCMWVGFMLYGRFAFVWLV